MNPNKIKNMERKWYKIVNGAWIEAPASIETERGAMYNYNCEANEERLREGGYLPENEIESQPTPTKTLTIEERVSNIEQVTEEVITALNEKGIVP